MTHPWKKRYTAMHEGEHARSTLSGTKKISTNQKQETQAMQ
jgi:hypothetical protein